jgi:hypothetical protein
MHTNGTRRGPADKADYYRRWEAMEFGNRVRMWPSLDALLADDYRGSLGVRCRVPAGPCRYGVDFADVRAAVGELAVAADLTPSDFTFNESAPDDRLLLQGEFTYAIVGGHYLFGSTAKVPMRKALATGTHHWRLDALGRLKAVCWPKSYDMLVELTDLYPDAVVEFGVYSAAIGCWPGHNAIVWEVREY